MHVISMHQGELCCHLNGLALRIVASVLPTAEVFRLLAALLQQ